MHLLKRLVIGRPFAATRMVQTLLPKRLALPVFASDALSSVAYATEAMLVVLVAASASAREALLPVSVGVAALLAIVVSWRAATRRRADRRSAAETVPASGAGAAAIRGFYAVVLTEPADAGRARGPFNGD